MLNYCLFDKHLNKILTGTVEKFGSRNHLESFLYRLCELGNVALVVRDLKSMSPLVVAKLVKNDKHLRKCVNLALNYAAEVAEGVLYDRAVNGYEEVTYNKEGDCIARKKKYCSKSLLEYLKANSAKYSDGMPKEQCKKFKNLSSKMVTGQSPETSSETAISNFEIESYAENEATG